MPHAGRSQRGLPRSISIKQPPAAAAFWVSPRDAPGLKKPLKKILEKILKKPLKKT
jgi:hypothetical protein